MEKREHLSVSTLKDIVRNILRVHIANMLKKSYEQVEFSLYHNQEFCNLLSTIQDDGNRLRREINSTYIALEQRKIFLSENDVGSSIVGTSTENHGLKIISQINIVLVKIIDKEMDGAAVLKYAEEKWPDCRFIVKLKTAPNFFTVNTIDVPMEKLLDIANWTICDNVEDYRGKENNA